MGSVLTERLAQSGHEITVVDAMWFGNFLSPNTNIRVIKADVSEAASYSLEGYDSVVHLANVANDPGVDLDPLLSWEVNALATQQLMDRASRAGVSQFIFASSGSVYGVSDEPEVTEELPLVPISAYNKTKMVAERVVMSYSDSMQVHCIRPATVCGPSPRMRFDVSVNMFAKQGFLDRRLTVFGGNQVRPNIHIDDLADVYRHFIEQPELPSGFYNAGFENISILEIAERVQELTGAPIEITATNDPRSYRQNSDKLLSTGFSPRKNVQKAIQEIISGLDSGAIVDRPEWYTMSWMKNHVIGRQTA